MYKYVLLLLAFLQMSCSDKSFLLTDLFESTEYVVLEEVMPELKSQIYAPNALYAQGGYLLFSEPKLDTLLMVYDVNADKSRRILPKGQGNMEAVSIETLGYGGNAASVYAHDMRAQSIYKIDLSGGLQNISIEKDTVDLSYAIGAVAYDGDMAVYALSGSDDRFVKVAPDGHKPFGEIEQISGVSSNVTTKILQGPCALSPQRKRMAWFASMGDAYEIYDYSDAENMQVILARKFYLPLPRNDGAITVKEHVGVTSVATSDDCIYALYIGKTFEEILKEAHGQEGLRSNKILVFDWDGNPICLLQLDKELYSIAYNRERQCLYGIGLDESTEYAIYRMKSN